jgi:oligoribonuclease
MTPLSTATAAETSTRSLTELIALHPSHIVNHDQARINDQNLVWLDMEMTGLLPDQDRILEVALVVTDSQLETIAEGPVLVIHQPPAIMDTLDEWNRKTHGNSGLIDKVAASCLTEAEAELIILDFLKRFIPKGQSPLCGNSIGQDRRFMARYMPTLEDYFHYRNLDVSTLKELCKRWKPDVYKQFKKHNQHTALADVYESIDELKFYRQYFLQP